MHSFDPTWVLTHNRRDVDRPRERHVHVTNELCPTCRTTGRDAGPEDTD